MLKLLFVVHRYPPYRGGSEYYVQQMAEEALRRGHDVTVYTDEHQGDLNNVKVSSNGHILGAQWDLIIVHGGGVRSQDTVHYNAHRISSPILYLLILPSESPICMKGLNDAKYIGCSTKADWEHCEKHLVLYKAKQIRHGVVIPNNLDVLISNKENYKSYMYNKYNIKTKYLLLSCGGFWQHKQFLELAGIVNSLNIDATLLLTGYHNNPDYIPNETDKVKTVIIEDRTDVAIAMLGSSLYIMHSTQEGFGLVLIESMFYKLPWVARDIAGAIELSNYGKTYSNDEQLIEMLNNLDKTINEFDVELAYTYAIEERSIRTTINDIEAVLISV